MTDKKKWYERLVDFAPAAATAFINPVAGGAMALKVLARKLGVSESKEEIESAIDRMEDSELKLKLKNLDLEFYKAQLDAHLAIISIEEKIQLGSYEVAKIEAASDDQYVRRTRPMIGRWSFYSGAAYSIIAELFQVIILLNNSLGMEKIVGKANNPEVISAVIEAIGKTIGTSGADPMIAAALFAPCMAYIGARTFDKVKPFNK